MNDIKQQIKDLTARLSKKGDKLKVRHSFNLQGISKETIYEIMSEIEFRYHINFTDEDIASAKNLPAMQKITIQKIQELDDYLERLHSLKEVVNGKAGDAL